MKNFFTKVILILTIGSLFGWSLFCFWKNKYAYSENAFFIEEKEENKISAEEIQKNLADKKIHDGRAEIINYIEKNINKISPQKAGSGMLWHPIKIWFIDDKNFYVDYKDDLSNIRRMLIFQFMEGPRAEYEILGFFIPGENGWILKSGKDIEGSSALKLYEKNEETEEWIAK